jgi:hypothetical protein
MRIVVSGGAAVVAAVALLATTSPPAVAAPAAKKAKIVKIKVVNGRPIGGIARPSVKKGTVVRFVVVANRGKQLHLHGYDVEKRVRPGKPTVIQVVTRIPGRFELELHDPDALLAQLTVRP